MRKLFRPPLFILVLLLLSSLMSQAQGEEVRLLVAQGVIDPIMARFIERGLAQAEREGVQCVIIQLDTPGGLDSSMRKIIQKIMGSRVPVVVYVAPAGARAASAGLFITLAAHIAAMAPATNIGAAHPVAVGGELPEAMEAKVVNDAAAYIRGIAEERGRNAAWAEEAVRRSVSLAAQEALEENVIDLIADNLEDLLQRIDGREVKTAWGEVTLGTAGAEVRRIEMSLPERLIHAIIDPNIAYILLTLGVFALIAEFRYPGMFIPGLSGVIMLILAFVAFGNLPVNWGGVVLIIIAVILFIIDIFVAGFILSIFGGIAFVLGSLLLFRPFKIPSPALPKLTVNPWLIAGMTALLGGFFILIISAAVRAQRAKVTSGAEGLIGAT
ncbi:TPA: nodulation protein NfeD, partial [Candidatus Bipolaricaulota bacterium]|nr:nodulation protein NfeD [Candidatus Bipolaricaulota bacterium]